MSETQPGSNGGALRVTRPLTDHVFCDIIEAQQKPAGSGRGCAAMVEIAACVYYITSAPIMSTKPLRVIRSGFSCLGGVMDREDKHNWLLIEDDEPAALAILLFLGSHIGYFSSEYIDEKVFYGLADEIALKNILDAMYAVGFLHTIGDGAFSIATDGKRWVQDQMQRTSETQS